MENDKADAEGAARLPLEPISQDWIRRYVDQLLDIAAKLGPESSMGAACVLRADHAMDLVKAWRERRVQSQETRA
jgi:hypothetical protein